MYSPILILRTSCAEILSCLFQCKDVLSVFVFFFARKIIIIDHSVEADVHKMVFILREVLRMNACYGNETQMQCGDVITR